MKTTIARIPGWAVGGAALLLVLLTLGYILSHPQRDLSEDAAVDTPEEEAALLATNDPFAGERENVNHPERPLLENIAQAKSLSTFLAAAQAADLGEMLQEPGEYTVFAPANAAFTQLPTAVLEGWMLPENREALSQVARYHIVPGSYPRESLRDGMRLRTLQGEELEITLQDGRFRVNGSAQILLEDAESSNGLLHIIDGVLLPRR